MERAAMSSQRLAHQHTGSAVYLAFEGRGATIIDGVRFD
jgi:gentisate 1,2-dioxygenase